MIGSAFTDQSLSKDFMLLYQNLGANFCALQSGYRSQKRPVLPLAHTQMQRSYLIKDPNLFQSATWLIIKPMIDITLIDIFYQLE